MKIQDIELDWLGHSGFRIIFKKKIIYIDPFQLDEESEKEKADFILLSHSHYDHCSFPDIDKISKDGTIIVCTADCQSKITRIQKKLEIILIEPGKQIKFEGFDMIAFPAYNNNKPFHLKNEAWVGYLINFGKTSVYHAGDTDFIKEMSQIKENSKDFLIALLPVDGKFNMNNQEAARACEIIKPNLAIPMHFGNIAGTEADAKRFIELCKEREIKADILDKS